MVLDVHLDKFFAVADWRIRPLPDGMFDYARSDSHFLIPIYLILMNMLSHNGLSMSQIMFDQDGKIKLNLGISQIFPVKEASYASEINSPARIK